MASDFKAIIPYAASCPGYCVYARAGVAVVFLRGVYGIVPWMCILFRPRKQDNQETKIFVVFSERKARHDKETNIHVLSHNWILGSRLYIAFVSSL